MVQPRSRCAARLRTGDVLPALQLALEHGHETGWQAVRLGGRPLSIGLHLTLGRCLYMPVYTRRHSRSSAPSWTESLHVPQGGVGRRLPSRDLSANRYRGVPKSPCHGSLNAFVGKEGEDTARRVQHFG